MSGSDVFLSCNAFRATIALAGHETITALIRTSQQPRHLAVADVAGSRNAADRDLFAGCQTIHTPQGRRGSALEALWATKSAKTGRPRSVNAEVVNAPAAMIGVTVDGLQNCFAHEVAVIPACWAGQAGVERKSGNAGVAHAGDEWRCTQSVSPLGSRAAWMIWGLTCPFGGRSRSDAATRRRDGLLPGLCWCPGRPRAGPPLAGPGWPDRRSGRHVFAAGGQGRI